MEPTTAINSPEVGCASFEVGGVVYTRTETLALGRAIKLQRFQTELQYDMSIPAVQKASMEIAADFNGNRLLDGMKKFGNLLDGMDLLGQNRYRQAEICALFYNAPGEDATADGYAEVIQPKVAAWRAVDAAFFTQTAFFLLLHFLQRCQPAPAAEPASPSLGDLPAS